MSHVTGRRGRDADGVPTGAFTDILDACDRLGELARRLGLGLLSAEDEALGGRTVRVGGADLRNFTSCSVLGLELDPRLVEGAASAARHFGTQFSVSRAFLSAPPYAELEAAVEVMTGGRAIVTPSTTLASLSALPSLVGEEDAVLLDHHVHMTVQLVVPLLQRAGVPVEFVRHGRLDRLDARIGALRARHRHVWLLLDGVTSMHGEAAPVDALAWLLDRHPTLRLYADDAHGTSWTGRHGRGHVLERLPAAARERAVVALSLNKSFGAGGGALVLPDEASFRRVRHTAVPLAFTGPLQPPMLGAALASARIHLSDELPVLQKDLAARVHFANRRAAELDLPVVGLGRELGGGREGPLVPIRFLGLGPQAASTAMAAHLIEEGFLASCALFPAVPAHQTGVRFTVTRHHREEDLDDLLCTAAAFLPRALAEGGVSRADVERAFGLAPPRRAAARASATGAPGAASAPVALPRLRLEHRTSIDDCDAAEWDRLLGARGAFDAAGLRALEEVFGAGGKPEHRWRFHYVFVRDAAGAAVLATVLTESLMKDDAFAEANVSRRVEALRRDDPAFLTSRVLAMGTPLTEGDALFLDRRTGGAGDTGDVGEPGTGERWEEALRLLVAHLGELAARGDARLTALRDLPTDDPELERLLLGQGFTRLAAPPSWFLDVTWRSPEEWLAGLSKRARRHQRREVMPHAADWEVRVLRSGTRHAGRDAAVLPPGLWAHLHGLYRRVHARSFAWNTFPLPERLLPTLLRHPGFEIVTLALRGGGAPGAFFAARVGSEAYVPFLVGLDDDAVRAHGAYRVSLATMVRRAEAVGARRVLLGLGAGLEKQRFGARAVERGVWVQTRDLFHADVLALLAAGVHAGGAAPRS